MMFRALQAIRRSFLMVFVFLPPCPFLGQGLATASATLQPSGEVRYQATYLFHLEAASGALVLDAPYSADEVERSGNLSSIGSSDQQWHLLRKICRDSKGRTRVERPLSLGVDTIHGPLLIEIFDAASGWVYVLDSQAKVAHSYRPPATGVSSPEVHEKRLIEATTAVSGQPLEHSTVQAFDSDTGYQPEKTATLPVTVSKFSQSLGEDHLDGLLIRGTRYTKPDVSKDGTGQSVSSEVWTSPELKVVVESRFLNPQASDRLVRLVHLSRAEPDPALFQIPAEYQVRDETTDFRVGVHLVLSQ